MTCVITNFQMSVAHAEDKVATSRATISFYGTIYEDNTQEIDSNPKSNSSSNTYSRLPTTGAVESNYGKYIGTFFIFTAFIIICRRKKEYSL